MDSRLIINGEEYAVREPPRSANPIERVRVIGRVRSGRWQVEWIEPNLGLVDYLKAVNFLVGSRRPLEALPTAARPLDSRVVHDLNL